ncbi:MAG: cation:proton antiporter [Calditrichaceae bacterium]
MIRKFIILILLILIFMGVKHLFIPSENIPAESTILTGLILLGAYLFALIINKWSFPKLTGYMILGVVLGPIGLNFLNNDIMGQLKVLESMALSFIALTAGGEFKFKQLKKFSKTLMYMFSGQVLTVFIGLIVLINVIAGYIPFLSTLDSQLIFGFSIILAGIAVSKSPATTIGIITELNAKGRVTDIVLSITVVKSIFLVITFPLMVAWAKLYLIENTVFNLKLISDLSINILGSISLGIIIGLIIIWYLKSIKVEKTIFMLGISIVITAISALLDFEILLISIITGIIVENFSEQGESLIDAIEQSSLPLYIIFFCFAGAGLHLETLKSALSLTILLVVARLIFIFIGNYAGSFLAGEEEIIKKHSWLGFIGQAGIAVGLATLIENSFPGEIGNQIKTILIATVVLNEFMGPILLKILLVKAKEIEVQN